MVGESATGSSASIFAWPPTVDGGSLFFCFSVQKMYNETIFMALLFFHFLFFWMQNFFPQIFYF